ncbi:MAG: ribosome biogenesis GTPase Der [Fibrobacterota bacterium]
MSDNNLPKVSVVGRPNVGKSTLFNRIAGKKIAVVDDEPGVTRDRNYCPSEWNGVRFMLIDTGGLLPGSGEKIDSEIRKQVMVAIDESSLIIFVLDMKAGITGIDQQISKLLRRSGKKVLAVVNKTDSISDMVYASEFYRLGLGDPVPVSSLHGRNIGDFLDLVSEALKELPEVPEEAADEINVAVTGRPNSGKSTLVNRFINSERMIVSDMPGTTRDAVDSVVEFDETVFRFIDTAGMRHKSHVKSKIEYYSNVRTIQAVERADVVVLMLDASRGVENQDLRILQIAVEHGKGILMCLNKWDLIDKETNTLSGILKDLHYKIPDSVRFPAVSISALSGQRCTRVIGMVKEIYTRMRKKLPTGGLDKFSDRIFREYLHPSVSGKNVKFFGIRQVSSAPLIFGVITNYPSLVRESYRRYILNRLYESFDLEGCPAKLRFMVPASGKGRKQNPKPPEEKGQEAAL